MKRPDEFWRDFLILLLFVCGFHLACNFAFLVEDDRPPHFDTSNHFQISIKQFHALAATEWTGDSLASLPRRINAINQYYPPLFYLFASPFYAAQGVHFGSARASNTFFLFLLVFGVYGIGKRLYNRSTGLLAAAVISFYPIVFGLSRDYYPDLALLAWMSLTVYFLLATEGLRRTGVAIFFGICYGLGQLTKQPFTFFAIGPCLFVFLDGIRPWPNFLRALGAPVRIAARRWAVPGLLFAALAFSADVMRLLQDPSRGILLTLRLGLEVVIALAGLAGFVWFLRRGWSELEEAPEEKRRYLLAWKQIGNGVLAAVIALAIAGPFFLANWEYIQSEGRFVVEQAGIDRGMAPASETLFQYARDIFSLQLHPFFTVLAIAGLLLYPRRHFRQKMFLIVAFLSAYLIMSSLRTKDPRYTMPFLYALAPLSVAWIFELRSPAQRWVATTAVLLIGLVQFFAISFGWGLPAGNGTGFALAGWVRPSPYGSTQTNLSNWRNRDIVADIARFGAHSPSPVIRTTLLCNTGFVQYASLGCEALRQGLPMEFTLPKSELQHDYARRLYELTLSDFIITKTGDQGPDFTLRSAVDLRDELNDPGSCLRTRFFWLKSYELPDRSTARLWMRTSLWPGQPPPTSALSMITLDYGNGRVIRGLSVEPPAVALGEIASVLIAWASPAAELGDAALFLQLRDAEGNPAYSERIDQSLGVPLALSGVDSLHLMRYPVYLNPRSQAGPGIYSVVLLLMVPERGEILVPRVSVPAPPAWEESEDTLPAPVQLTFEAAEAGVLRPVERTHAALPAEYAGRAAPEAAPDGVIRLGDIEVLPERAPHPVSCEEAFKQLEHLQS